MMMTESKLALYIAIAPAATTQPALAQQDFGVWGNHMGGVWHGWFIGPLVWLVLLAVVVALTVYIVRALTQRGANLVNEMPGSRTGPLDILKERFAKGEIDKKEFDERRSHLGL